MKRGVLQVTEHGVMFWCKGCGMFHFVNLDSTYSPIAWNFNGNYEKPTFIPSVLVADQRGGICHSFVIEGKVQYFPDCTHEFSGKDVYLDDVKEAQE